MFKEIQKSINSSLYERFTSPVWGAIIAGWLIINWQVIYITIFGNEEYLGCGKLDYILTYLYSPLKFYLQPILITLLLTFIFPFISNGAYFMHLKFKKWKEIKRNELEDKTPLNIDQSIILRESLRNQEEALERITANKDSKIENLKSQISDLIQRHKTENENLKSQIDDLAKAHKTELENLKLSEKKKNEDSSSMIIDNSSRTKTERDYWNEDFEIVEDNEDLKKSLYELINQFTNGVYHSHVNEIENFDLLVKFGLVDKDNGDFFNLTKKGKHFGIRLLEK